MGRWNSACRPRCTAISPAEPRPSPSAQHWPQPLRFIATHNPASSSSPYPTCAFHQATGLWCPGCGLTRGTYQLLHGHIGAALSYNIFTPVALAAIVVVWLGWVRVSWGASPMRVPPHTARWLAIITPALLLLYGVLRNVPVAPLRALAP